jgi:cohesin loading factor subunit SCC2
MIMDAIFASPEEDGRGRLLKIMQDFLISEASKHSAKEKGVKPGRHRYTFNLYSATENIKGKSKRSDVNMDELVGNTDGFADSGYEYISRRLAELFVDPPK